MNAYHNIWGPPQSTVLKTVKPVGKQIIFGFRHVGLQVPGDNPNLSESKRDELIHDWLMKYVAQHKAELDTVIRPMGYMIANVIGNDDMTMGELDRIYPGCIRCSNPILTLSVIGRMSGNLYIPHRVLNLNCHAIGYNQTFMFPANCFLNLDDIGRRP